MFSQELCLSPFLHLCKISVDADWAFPGRGKCDVGSLQRFGWRNQKLILICEFTDPNNFDLKYVLT